MSFLALVLGCVFSGNTLLACPNQPLDQWMIGTPVVEGHVEQPFLEGVASWYDYKLNGKWRSKSHSTCALRIKERYWRYKVCAWERCVECYHNDYWPAEYTNKVIDLSSYAFKQLAPLSRWVVDVQIYKLD